VGKVAGDTTGVSLPESALDKARTDDEIQGNLGKTASATTKGLGKTVCFPLHHSQKLSTYSWFRLETPLEPSEGAI
jgi:hypothetical protein